MLSVFCTILLLLQYFFVSVNGVVPKGAPFSITITTKNDLATFTIQGKKDIGYMAIGLGTSMDGSEIFITWFDSEGNAKVTYNRGQGHTLPELLSDETLPINKALSKIDNTYQTIVFTRALKSPISNGINIKASGDISMIWAYSTTKPTDAGKIVRHTGRGVFTYSLKASDNQSNKNKPKTGGDNGDSDSKNKTEDDKPDLSTGLPDIVIPEPTSAQIVHGTLMLMAWVIMPSIAIFIARYMKTQLGVWWFRLHWAFFTGSGIIAILAIIVIYLDVGNVTDNPHSIMGITTMCLYGIQIIIGIVIDRLYDPGRIMPPIQDKIHWWFGRVIFLLALATIIYGITLLSKPLYFAIPFGILIAIIIGWFVYYQVKFGKDEHAAIPLNNISN